MAGALNSANIDSPIEKVTWKAPPLLAELVHGAQDPVSALIGYGLVGTYYGYSPVNAANQLGLIPH